MLEGKDARDYFRNEHRHVSLGELGAVRRAAVSLWTLRGQEINRYLRELTDTLRAELDEAVRPLSEAIEEQNETDVDLVLYRGVHRSFANYAADADKGFMSLTTRIGLARKFPAWVRLPDKVLLRVIVPRGTRGLWVPEHCMPTTKFTNQQEFLLPRFGVFLDSETFRGTMEDEQVNELTVRLDNG